MIEVNPTGVYVTERGVAVQKQAILISVPEWQFLWELSAASSTPIGNLIMKLARAESLRIRDAQYFTPILQHASHR